MSERQLQFDFEMPVPSPITQRADVPINWRSTFLHKHVAELLEYVPPENSAYRPADDVLALKELRLDLESLWRKQHGQQAITQDFKRKLDRLDWLRLQKFFATEWTDIRTYLDIPVLDELTGSMYYNLTNLLNEKNYPGVLLRTRSGAGKTVTCRRLVYDCFNSSTRTEADHTVAGANLFGHLPVWIDFSRVPRWEEALEECNSRGRLDRFLWQVLLCIAGPSQPTEEHLIRILLLGPPLLLICDLNSINYQQRCLIANAFAIYLRDYASRGHRCIVTYRSMESQDQIRTNLGHLFTRVDLLPLAPVLAGQYLAGIERYRSQAAIAVGIDFPILDDTRLEAYRNRVVALVQRYARPNVRQHTPGAVSTDEGPLISTPLLMHFLSVVPLERLLDQSAPKKHLLIASISDIYAEVVRRSITRDQEQTLLKHHFAGSEGHTRLRIAYARIAARMVADGNVRLSLLAVQAILKKPISVPPPPWWPLTSDSANSVWNSSNPYRASVFRDVEQRSLVGSSLLRVVGEGDAAEIGFVHDSFRDYFFGAVLLGECFGPDDPPPARGSRALPNDRLLPFAVYQTITDFAQRNPRAALNILPYFGGTLRTNEFRDLTTCLLRPESNREMVNLFWNVLRSRPLTYDRVLDAIAWSIQRRNNQVLETNPEWLLDFLIHDLTGDRAVRLGLKHSTHSHQKEIDDFIISDLTPARLNRGTTWLRRIWGHGPPRSLEMNEHDGSVLAIAVTTEGRIITGDENGTVVLWNPDQGEVTKLIQKTHNVAQRVCSITTLSDGRWISTDDRDLIHAWSDESIPKSLGTFGPPREHWSSWDCDKSRLLSNGDILLYGNSTTLSIIDPEIKITRQMSTLSHGYRSIVHLTNGFLVTADETGKIQLVEIATGACRILGQGVGRLKGIGVLQDGRIVTVGSEPGVTIWHQDGVKQDAICNHSSEGNCLVVLADGNIAYGCDDGIVRIFNVNTNETRELYRHHRFGIVRCICIVDLETIASGGDDASVRLFRVAGGQFGNFRPHEQRVEFIVPLSLGRVVTSSESGNIRMWNTIDGTTSVLQSELRKCSGRFVRRRIRAAMRGVIAPQDALAAFRSDQDSLCFTLESRMQGVADIERRWRIYKIGRFVLAIDCGIGHSSCFFAADDRISVLSVDSNTSIIYYGLEDGRVGALELVVPSEEAKKIGL